MPEEERNLYSGPLNPTREFILKIGTLKLTRLSQPFRESCERKYFWWAVQVPESLVWDQLSLAITSQKIREDWEPPVRISIRREMLAQLIVDVEHSHVRFLGNLVLNLWVNIIKRVGLFWHDRIAEGWWIQCKNNLFTRQSGSFHGELFAISTRSHFQKRTSTHLCLWRGITRIWPRHVRGFEGTKSLTSEAHIWVMPRSNPYKLANGQSLLSCPQDGSRSGGDEEWDLRRTSWASEKKIQRTRNYVSCYINMGRNVIQGRPTIVTTYCSTYAGVVDHSLHLNPQYSDAWTALAGVCKQRRRRGGRFVWAHHVSRHIPCHSRQ